VHTTSDCIYSLCAFQILACKEPFPRNMVMIHAVLHSAPAAYLNRSSGDSAISEKNRRDRRGENCDSPSGLFIIFIHNSARSSEYELEQRCFHAKVCSVVSQVSMFHIPHIFYRNSSLINEQDKKQP